MLLIDGYCLNFLLSFAFLFNSAVSAPNEAQVVGDALKKKLQAGDKWKINLNDFKAMNVSTILEMDILDPFIAQAVAKMSKSWTLEDRLRILNKVTASKNKKMMEFYGRRLNLKDIKTIDQFEMVKDYIPMMSAKHLMSVKDANIKTIIISALSKANSNTRINMMPLLLKFYGHPSQWTVDNFLSIMPFISKIPEVIVKQINSTMAYNAGNQLNSVFSALFLSAKPQANAFMKVLMSHLNWSNPADVNTFKQFQNLRKAVMDLKGLSDEAKTVIMADTSLVPNLQSSTEETEELIKETLKGKTNIDKATLSKLGKAIGRLQPRDLKDVFLDQGTLNSAVSGPVYSRQNLNLFTKQAEKLYAKRTQFPQIPRKLLSRVMTRDDIPLMTLSYSLALLNLLRQSGVKESVNMGQILTVFKSAGGAKKLIAADLDIGNFAMAISAQDVESWTIAELEKLLVDRNAKNSILEDILIARKYNDTIFIAEDVGNGMLLKALPEKIWMNITEADLQELLTNEKVRMIVENQSVPALVYNLAEVLEKLSKSKSMSMLGTDEKVNSANMVSVHTDLGIYPPAVVAQALSLDEILAQGRCQELLVHLPKTFAAMTNYGGRRKRQMFGKFLADCVDANDEYLWDVLSSSALVDLPMEFLNEQSNEDIMLAWMSQDLAMISCVPSSIAEKISKKIERTIRPQDIASDSYRRLSPLLKYFSDSFLMKIREDVIVDVGLDINAGRLMMKDADNEGVRRKGEIMAMMCKAYLTSSEMRQMERAQRTFNDFVRSIGIKVAQRVSSSNESARPKRAAMPALTCAQVQMMGEGVLAVTVDHVKTISGSEILNCYDEFGKHPDLKTSIRDAVLQKTLEGLNGLGNATADDVKTMGYLLLSLTPGQINDSLKMDSWDMVRVFGRISKFLSEEQMSVIAMGLKADLKNSLMMYSKAELADISNIFCSFPLDEIRVLTKDVFMKYEMMLSRLQNCNDDTMMVLGELARSVYGNPETWDAITIRRLGIIPAGLEPSYFMKIKPEAFSGFTPSAVEAMCDANIEALQPDQLKMMRPETVWAFDEDQRSKFSASTMEAYKLKLGAVADDISENHAVATYPSIMVITFTIFSILLNLH